MLLLTVTKNQQQTLYYPRVE